VQANNWAAYDDWRRARDQWDYFYSRNRCSPNLFARCSTVRGPAEGGWKPARKLAGARKQCTAPPGVFWGMRIAPGCARVSSDGISFFVHALLCFWWELRSHCCGEAPLRCSHADCVGLPADAASACAGR